MFTTGKTVGLVEWIIDDTYLDNAVIVELASVSQFLIL